MVGQIVCDHVFGVFLPGEKSFWKLKIYYFNFINDIQNANFVPIKPKKALKMAATIWVQLSMESNLVLSSIEPSIVGKKICDV